MFVCCANGCLQVHICEQGVSVVVDGLLRMHRTYWAAAEAKNSSRTVRKVTWMHCTAPLPICTLGGWLLLVTCAAVRGSGSDMCDVAGKRGAQWSALSLMMCKQQHSCTCRLYTSGIEIYTLVAKGCGSLVLLPNDVTDPAAHGSA
jgi:hypothetical protein